MSTFLPRTTTQSHSISTFQPVAKAQNQTIITIQPVTKIVSTAQLKNIITNPQYKFYIWISLNKQKLKISDSSHLIKCKIMKIQHCQKRFVFLIGNR
jgi:hypothetical protein